jgi:uncharacterized protein (DUF58 family)
MMQEIPPPLWQPLAHFRWRMQRWFLTRQRPSDSITLTQRNVYILPTRSGFMLAITILVLLLASINYQLNLGYLLSFLLSGCALVGIHVCHRTLLGLTMNLIAPEAIFTGDTAIIGINLQNQLGTVRYGIGVAVLGSGQWVWADVPAQGCAVVHVAFKPTRRGLHPLPTLSAETRFPMGTFRVWTVWRAAAQVLVYPNPEPMPPPLPAGEPLAGGATVTHHRHDSGEFEGVRAYQRGDPLKMVIWKKFASRGELVSRDTSQAQRHELWLEQFHCDLAQPEQQMSRLCAWVLMAEERGLIYGLRLAGLEIKPELGEVHKKRCLRALALYS